MLHIILAWSISTKKTVFTAFAKFLGLSQNEPHKTLPVFTFEVARQSYPLKKIDGSLLS